MPKTFILADFHPVPFAMHLNKIAIKTNPIIFFGFCYRIIAQNEAIQHSTLLLNFENEILF